MIKFNKCRVLTEIRMTKFKRQEKTKHAFQFFFVRKYVLLEHHKSMDKKSETQRESQEQ